MIQKEQIIKVENLFAHYGEKKILKGVSLTIYRGEIVVIMGGSGSGKSTLLSLIRGLYTPPVGNVYINGEKIKKGFAKLKKIVRNIDTTEGLKRVAENTTLYIEILKRFAGNNKNFVNDFRV